MSSLYHLYVENGDPVAMMAHICALSERLSRAIQHYTHTPSTATANSSDMRACAVSRRSLTASCCAAPLGVSLPRWRLAVCAVRSAGGAHDGPPARSSPKPAETSEPHPRRSSAARRSRLRVRYATSAATLPCLPSFSGLPPTYSPAFHPSLRPSTRLRASTT